MRLDFKQYPYSTALEETDGLEQYEANEKFKNSGQNKPLDKLEEVTILNKASYLEQSAIQRIKQHKHPDGDGVKDIDEAIRQLHMLKNIIYG